MIVMSACIFGVCFEQHTACTLQSVVRCDYSRLARWLYIASATQHPWLPERHCSWYKGFPFLYHMRGMYGKVVQWCRVVAITVITTSCLSDYSACILYLCMIHIVESIRTQPHAYVHIHHVLYTNMAKCTQWTLWGCAGVVAYIIYANGRTVNRILLFLGLIQQPAT